MTRRARSAPVSGPSFSAMASAAARLTDRDRLLLAALASQRVLTTPMLTDLGFGSPITARHRLAKLVDEVKVVARFRPHAPVGSHPWHYVLTPLGAHVVAQSTGQEPEKLRSRARRDMDLAVSPGAQLAHTLGANAVYTALHRAALTSNGRAQLVHWYTERDQERGSRFSTPTLRPDGAGTWAEQPGGPGGYPWPRQVPFALEYDTGTEKHQILLKKVWAYRNLLVSKQTDQHYDRLEWFGDDYTNGGYPAVVLFVFASAGREYNVRRALLNFRRDNGAVPRVATATHHVGQDIVGPIWTLLPEPGAAASPPTKVTLAALGKTVPHSQPPELLTVPPAPGKPEPRVPHQPAAETGFNDAYGDFWQDSTEGRWSR
jgi:hypothetical protein